MSPEREGWRLQRNENTLPFSYKNFTFLNHHSEKTFPWEGTCLTSGWHQSTVPEMCSSLSLTSQESVHDLALFTEMWKLQCYLLHACTAAV